MNLQIIPGSFAVCRLAEGTPIPANDDFWFLSRTDEELSLVCRSESVPELVQRVEDGWRMFRIYGELDFALTGILAGLSAVLARAGIPLFAVSTFNTDYILVKSVHFDRAVEVLRADGHAFNPD